MKQEVLLLLEYLPTNGISQAVKRDILEVYATKYREKVPDLLVKHTDLVKLVSRENREVHIF